MQASKILIAVIVACSAVASGCADKSRQTDPSAVRDQMNVTIGGRSLWSAQPGVLHVVASKDKPNTAEFSLSIENEVSIVISAPYSSLPVFRAAAVDKPDPSGAPYANVAVDGKQVTGGSVKISVAGGRVSGGLESVGLAFNGTVVIGCSVAPSQLTPDTPVPQPSDTSTQVLVDDVNFESAECARVKAALF